MRKIVHVDMDAFFAAVEQRDAPELRGRPLAVGGSGGRGVVMTASYEARTFGVRSAMPSVTAKRLCPDLLFVPARMDVYKEASRQIRRVFHRYTELVEPLSLDEAYLDVTEPLQGAASATAIAHAIKNEIHEATGLTASAGVSFNKFLAKIASDMDKPDGLTVIRPEEADGFLAALPVEKFHGVGPVTAKKLRAAGISSGADLRAQGLIALTGRFGRLGGYLWHIAHGRDERDVRADRERKSVGAERTFGQDLTGLAAMTEALLPIAEKLAVRIRDAGAAPRTLTLKLKDNAFRIQSRARSGIEQRYDAATLHRIGSELLHEAAPKKPIRLLGLAGSGLNPRDADQFDLFAQSTPSGRQSE